MRAALGLHGRTHSTPLQQQALLWANRLSFGDVARLLEQMSGAAVLSEGGVWRLVQQAAQQLDETQQAAIGAVTDCPEPHYRTPPELYDATSAEFVVLTDGIGVKAQKPTRQPQGTPRVPRVEKRHDTDVLLLPRAAGGHQVLCEGLSGNWSLVEAARAFLKRELAGHSLAVVAVTDGAKSIRGDLAALFGSQVRVILDWYHLEKRVYQQLSMVASSMAQREAWERQLLSWLWRGQVAPAQAFLADLKSRNGKALAGLVGYLDKHASEIIDYEVRQQAGKPIGSGRMEKCVDQVIGHGQKDKGMSWTQAGSHALALLKVAEINAATPALA